MIDENILLRYAKATGHAECMFTMIGIMLKYRSSEPAKDLDELQDYLDRRLPQFREWAGGGQ